MSLLYSQWCTCELNSPAMRHEKAGDALTDAEWIGLAGMFGSAKAVLYDNVDGKILYVLNTVSLEKKIKVVVAPDFWNKGRNVGPSTRTVFRMNVNALRDAKRYTLISGVLK